jgi:hypothetical protein
VDVTAAQRRAVLAALLAASPACDRDAVPAHDSTVAVASGAAIARVATAGAKPDCPRTGHWSPCQVKIRLEQAGAAPRPGTRASLPKLGVAPTVYLVGNAELALYLFPDPASRARAARALDSTQFVSPATALSMRGEATAIQSDNLLALLFTRREQQRERVSDALSAGPPMP